ncbi:chromosomal replication initiator protein DnaA [bacterium]|nr:chromosomal replication initiator protein DnaA [bacterium]
MDSEHIAFTEQDLREIWQGCIQNVDATMLKFLKEATPVDFDSNNCLIVEAAPFIISRYSDPQRQELLNRLLVEHTGIPNATVAFVPKASSVHPGSASINTPPTARAALNEPGKTTSPFDRVIINSPSPAVSSSSADPSDAILEQFSVGIGAKTTDLAQQNSEGSSSAADNIQIISQKPTDSLSINYGDTHLSREFTFENYVCGENNEIAVGAARSVAQGPGAENNPLFFYSGVGLGKTHLMHAIGNYIFDHYPTKRVLYMPAESFLNEYIDVAFNKKRGGFQEFHARYRENIDVLLVDDMQFMIGKEKTLEEFFHTFEAIKNNKGQIVISSDRPPNELPTITKRMTSRLNQGLIIDIQAPKLETRIAILRQKAGQKDYSIGNDVLSFIAESYFANVRDLEGALNRVITICSLQGKPITLENAKEALKVETQANPPSPEAIMKAVVDYFNISENVLTSNSRNQTIVKPRYIAMYLMNELTDLSLTDIGKIFERKHSTVIHARDWINENPEDPFIKNSLVNLRSMLKIK